jgi:hypothetical protein
MSRPERLRCRDGWIGLEDERSRIDRSAARQLRSRSNESLDINGGINRREVSIFHEARLRAREPLAVSETVNSF